MDNALFLSQANTNAENPKLISAVLCAALYPNVVQVTVLLLNLPVSCFMSTKGYP